MSQRPALYKYGNVLALKFNRFKTTYNPPAEYKINSRQGSVSKSNIVKLNQNSSRDR